MAIQENQLVEVAYCLEPAGSAPDMQALAYTSFGLNAQIATYQDEAITADGNVGDLRHGARTGKMALQDHLCYRAHDALLAAMARGEWVNGVSVAGTFSIDAATGSLSRADGGSFVADGFESGDIVGLEDFASEGEFRVRSVSASALLLAGDLESESGVTGRVFVVGAKLKNGVKHVDLKFQRRTPDLSGKDVRLGHRVRVATADLSITTTGLIGLNLTGEAIDVEQVAVPLDASPRPVLRRLLMTGFDSSVLLAGDDLGTVTDFSQKVDNAPQGSSYIGSRTRKKLLNSRFKNSGEITAEPEDDRLIDLFLNEGEASVWTQATTEDGTGWYVFHQPRCKFTSHEETVQGEGALSAKADYTALKSAEHGCTLVIQRRHPVA